MNSMLLKEERQLRKYLKVLEKYKTKRELLFGSNRTS